MHYVKCNILESVLIVNFGSVYMMGAMDLRLILPYCLLLLLRVRVYSAPTTVKPYAFGFELQGAQHRTEVRTPDGIVKGEYGFQTVDGYYITTVYEIDDQGRFRVKSVKRSKKAPIIFPDVEKKNAPPSPAPLADSPTPPPRVKIYQFNYTAWDPLNPILGHQEMGFSDTSKMGDYFRKTDDGWQYFVSYNADDANGFVPRVKISFGQNP